MRIPTQKVGKLQKIGRQQTLIDAISGFMADFLRLIDANVGGFRQKKGQGILHPRIRIHRSHFHCATEVSWGTPMLGLILRGASGREDCRGGSPESQGVAKCTVVGDRYDWTTGLPDNGNDCLGNPNGGLAKGGLARKGPIGPKRALSGQFLLFPRGCGVQRNWSRSAPKRP